jgi:hypothetical protein
LATFFQILQISGNKIKFLSEILANQSIKEMQQNFSLKFGLENIIRLLRIFGLKNWLNLMNYCWFADFSKEFLRSR